MEIATKTLKPYIFDDAATLEYQRLDLMSKILDPWTRGYLTALGVSQGWQCLELGSGNGSIAEWLSETVSPSGNVTAIDINPVLLELIPAQNLTVQQMDVRTGELRANAYDLITCRALLHQIAEYGPAVLARMPAAVKPGGWLLVQEAGRCTSGCSSLRCAIAWLTVAGSTPRRSTPPQGHWKPRTAGRSAG